MTATTTAKKAHRPCRGSGRCVDGNGITLNENLIGVGKNGFKSGKNDRRISQ